LVETVISDVLNKFFNICDNQLEYTLHKTLSFKFAENKELLNIEAFYLLILVVFLKVESCKGVVHK
jgi:hypothetical protein